MPDTSVTYRCTNRSGKKRKCRIYWLPTDPPKRELWRRMLCAGSQAGKAVIISVCLSTKNLRSYGIACQAGPPPFQHATYVHPRSSGYEYSLHTYVACQAHLFYYATTYAHVHPVYEYIHTLKMNYQTAIPMTSTWMKIWDIMLPQAPNSPPPTHTHTVVSELHYVIRRLSLLFTYTGLPTYHIFMVVFNFPSTNLRRDSV